MDDFVKNFEIYNDLEKCLVMLEKYKSIKVFVKNATHKNEILPIISKFCGNVNLVMSENALHVEVDNIPNSGEEIVVSYGDGETTDIAKFYACSYGEDVIAILTGEYYDYTFSKFALISDGVTFNFYNTTSPIAFFVKSGSVSEEMIAYVKAKSIEYFDFCVNEILLQDKINDDAKQFFKNTIFELRLENFSEKSIIKAFLRLGMAMTFYDTTKYFCFGYFDLFCLLKTLKIDEKCKVACDMIIKVYKTCFKYRISCGQVSMNSVINKLAKLLGVPCFSVMKIINKLPDLENRKGQVIKINAYKEYLQSLLYRLMVTIKPYNKKTNAKIVSLASFLSHRKSLLKTLCEIGMLKV